MRLIKNIGSRFESATSIRTKQFGVFECPVCREHVERPLSHGRRNKSCGKRDCRKAILVYSACNIYKKENTIWDKPYYTNICGIYEKVKKEYTIQKEINNRKAFMELFYKSYEELRKIHPSNYFTIITKDFSNIITAENAILVHSSEDYIEESKYVNAHAYCCRKLIHDTGCTYAVAIGMIKKLTKNYVESTIETRQKRKLKCFLIEPEVYIKVKHIIETNSGNKTPTKVYVVQSGQFTKLGITNNIDKRLQSIGSSNPFGVTLKYCKEFGSVAYAIEQYLHECYKNDRHTFEWFKLNEEQIEEIINLLDNGILEVLKKVNEQNERFRLHKLKEYNNAKINMKQKSVKFKSLPVKDINKKPKIETIHEWGDERFKHNRTNQIESTTTHGMSHTLLYKTWQTMKKIYPICEEWQTFEPFQKVVEQEYAAYTEEQVARVYPLVVGIPIGPTNYKIESKFQHEVKSVVAKAVEKLGQQGNVLAEYASVTEAANSVNGIAAKISAVCNGTRKTHAGFKWRYKE